MIEQLSDSELAVTADSLRETGTRLRNSGVATPNIESAIEKLNSIVEPTTHGVLVLAVEPRRPVYEYGRDLIAHLLDSGDFQFSEDEERRLLRAYDALSGL